MGIQNQITYHILIGNVSYSFVAPAGLTIAELKAEHPELGDFIDDAYDAVVLLSRQSNTDFKNLPNWATWTAAEAESFVSSNIFGGLTQAQVDSQIDALPNTIAGLKTGLKQAAAAILSIRTILMAMAKAIVYLRNLVLK